MIVTESKFGEQVVNQKASSMQVPSGCGILMLRIYRDVLPRVRKYLEFKLYLSPQVRESRKAKD